MSALALISRIPLSFWRFGLVGVGGLFVDMAVLYAVMWVIGLAAVSAKVFSFLAAATFTWWMNRRYTFGDSGKSLLHEWSSFLATNAFGGAVNFAVYTAMVTLLFPFVWMPALATAMGSLSGLLFNYLASRHIVFNQTQRPKTTPMNFSVETPPLPWVAYPLTLVVCLAFGGVALWLGMDASWDLRNYHWHGGWTFVNGLVGRDLLVGQLASFYNPTLDIPYAWVADRLPARAIGFALGMAHGLNFLLLFAIGWRLSTLADLRHRFALAIIPAFAGILGAGGLSEVGMVFYDNVLSLGVSASVLLVISRWNVLDQGRSSSAASWAVATGIPVGLAFGLKQPMAIYCIGLCVAFLSACMPWPRRIWIASWFGIGVLLGFAIGGGHWAWHLWKAYGNPLFPYFNQFFRSPWGLSISYRDDKFVPHSLAEKLLLVFRFSFDTRLVGESDFRDFRILALTTVVPLAALVWRWLKPASRITHSGPTGWLLVAGLLTYAVWVAMFSIYRYLVPLEMLAPILLVSAVGLLPVAAGTRQYAAIGLLGILVVFTVPGDWLRVPWEERAVEVMGAESLSVPANTLVLLSGHEPLSFLIPAFPKNLRFYRIDSTFTLPEDPDIGFRKVFRDAIRNNPGPVASLHIVKERHEAIKKLAGFGLELDIPSCRPLSSPIGAGAYAFCLTRKLDASPG